MTEVVHVIELKNRTPTMYATQYALKINSPNIEKIQVKSNNLSIKPAVARTDNQTSIGLTFPDTILGQGKSRIIEISYQDANAAVISGKVLEVMVPKLANANEYDAYSLTIRTPTSYGLPNRVTPPDYSTEETTEHVLTRFQLQNGEGVVALFGTEQIFNLDLMYQLENNSSNTGLAQIALPPDTAFQRVWYRELNPPPQNINRDDDGNWIATYEIQPQQMLEVKASGQVLSTLDPQPLGTYTVNPNQHIGSQEFWPVDDSEIKNLSQKYQTPRQIYDYVVDTLSYNYQALDAVVPRLGASKAIASPQLATCQEYTDLFVALARANKIPSRRVTGYAYTQNSLLRPLDLDGDILHAWPEYYDSNRKIWIPIDPTWGDTTGGVNYFDQFDLNHVAFAINGQSSTLPFPAGAYKASAQSRADTVSVTFGDQFPTGTPEFEFQLKPAMNMGVPLPGNYLLQVSNRQGRAWYNIAITATSSQPVASLPQTIDLPQILPFETVSLPLQLFGNEIWQGETHDLQLEVSYVENQQHNQRQTVEVSPLLIKEGGYLSRILSFPVTIPSLVIGSISLALFSGSLLVRRRKR